MKAAVYHAFGKPPAIERLPDPTPSDRGVVIRVKATGLCRSDWHGWMGHDPDIRLPNVPGHELAGVVEATGKQVVRWKAGDRVTVPFVCGCGTCPQCNSGNHHICDRQSQPGFTHWGSFAEYVAIDYADVNLVRLPDDIDFVTAASLGCRFVTSFRAMVELGKVTGGQWVAVHGCGGVGLSAIMIAASLGANVVAIDIHDEKLDFARAAGAVATVNAANSINAENSISAENIANDPNSISAAKKEDVDQQSATNRDDVVRQIAANRDDVVRQVVELTGGGAHVSVDALGSPVTCFNSIANLRKRGKHIQIGLMMADHRHAAVPMDQVIANELEILGSHGMQAHKYPELLAMIRAGKLHPQKLVGKTIRLEESPEALITMDQHTGTGVTVIDSF